MCQTGAYRISYVKNQLTLDAVIVPVQRKACLVPQFHMAPLAFEFRVRLVSGMMHSLIKTSLGCSMIHMHKIPSLGPSLGQPTARLT